MTRLQSREDVAWLAGILEGEGYFVVQPDSIILGVGMKDKDILSRVEDITGLGRVYGPYDIRGTEMYQWKIGAMDDVYAVVVAVYPFLGGRRKRQARALVKWFRANGPYKHGRKLSRKDVLDAMRRYDHDDQLTYGQLADEYGVARTTIGNRVRQLRRRREE